jgi:hypothetical protein
MRVTVGANQQMEPTGDVAYVTCGPFQCTESTDMVAMAPAITTGDSEICSAWSPNFNPEVGRVDNAGDPSFTGELTTASSATGLSENPNTGIDFGWSYTSDAGFTAAHSLAIVSAKSGAVKKTSTKKSLMVPDVGDGIHGSAVENDPDTDADETVIAPCDHYDGLTGNVAKPGGGNCFRILANPDANYWENYEVTLTSDESIGWGKISWDAFKDLDCVKSVYTPSEDVDVCELFAEEVGLLGKVTANAKIAADLDTDRSTSVQIHGFDFAIKQAAKGKRFNSLWYMQSTKSGKSKKADDANTTDLYVDSDTGTDGLQPADVSKTGDTTYWYATIDDDNDPKADLGDFGFVDSNGDDAPDNFGGADDVECSRDDGGEKRTALDKQGTADDTTDDEGNGSLCDAEDVEFEASVTFVDGIGLGCSETLAITVTCQWDADGGEAAAVTTNADGDDVVSRTVAAVFAANATAGYLSCKATSAVE